MLGAGAIDKQRLGRAANPRSAHFGVERDLLRHIEIGRRMHEHMIDAFEMREHRQARFILHARHEALAASSAR